MAADGEPKTVHKSALSRRQMLKRLVKVGTPLGVLAGAGLYGGYAYLPPQRSMPLDSVENLAVQLFQSLVC